MTLTEFFEEGYFYFLITLFGLGMVLATFIISLLKTKKLPVIQLVFLILFVCIALFKPICVWIFQVAPKLKDIDLHFDFYTTLLCLLLVIASYVCHLLFTSGSLSNKSIYMLAPNKLGRPVYAYLSKEGNVMSYNEEFFNELNVSFKEQKKWYKEVSAFYINGEECGFYEDFLSRIQGISDDTFKVSLKIDTEEITFNINKIVIEKDEELIGYVLAAPVENKIPGNDGFLKVINDLSQPYAYYNDDSRGVIFMINDKFKDLLGIKGNTVGYPELRHYVFADDLGSFDSSANDLTENKSYRYRLQTNDGLKMFEEVKMIDEDKVIIVLSLCEDNDSKLSDKNELLKYVDKLIGENKEYGSVIVSMNSIVALYDELGANVTKELVSRYILFLSKEVLKENDSICRISDMEYAILFNDVSMFDAVVRDIAKGISSLLKFNVTYNDKEYELNNKLGIVYSSKEIKSPSELMKALDEALSFANNPNYENDYSIYTSKETDEKKVPSNEEYKFEDYKIDLDNSFLDDDQKDKKE